MARFKCRLGRDGAQTYPGGERHRDASEVFHPASLAGLSGLRVQRGHVPARGVSVGYVVPGSVGRLNSGDAQGRSYIAAELHITDAATAADIRSGRLREISLSYTCEVVRDAHGREHQTQIRYAMPECHVALLDSRTETARCGEHCAIQRDSMIVTSDGGSITADCGCADNAERDRMNAWIDAACARYDVQRDALISQAARMYGGKAEFTRDIAMSAGAALAQSDDAFRARLRTDSSEPIDAVERSIAAAVPNLPMRNRAQLAARVRHLMVHEGRSLETAVGLATGTRVADSTGAAHPDDAFRAELARKAGAL